MCTMFEIDQNYSCFVIEINVEMFSDSQTKGTDISYVSYFLDSVSYITPH